MRKFLFFLLLLPSFLHAQINRSATEFAKENVQEYLAKKLFKDRTYKSVSFSELRSHVDINARIAWTIDHKFEITEKNGSFRNTSEVQKPYRFIFYLDEKMKVIRAESYLVY